MIKNKDLHKILIGQAGIAEARRAIRLCVEAGDEGDVEDVYVALRGWTWRAMNLRRLDSELKEWFSLVRSIEAVIQAKNPKTANRLSVLSDLIYESVRFSERSTDAQLLQRDHIYEILIFLRTKNGSARRKEIFDALDLNNTQLSQILTELCVRGKLDRNQVSREAEFSLTDTGRELVDNFVKKRADEKASIEKQKKTFYLDVKIADFEYISEKTSKGSGKETRLLPDWADSEIQRKSRGRESLVVVWKPGGEVRDIPSPTVFAPRAQKFHTSGPRFVSPSDSDELKAVEVRKNALMQKFPAKESDLSLLASGDMAYGR